MIVSTAGAWTKCDSCIWIFPFVSHKSFGANRIEVHVGGLKTGFHPSAFLIQLHTSAPLLGADQSKERCDKEWQNKIKFEAQSWRPNSEATQK
jgi:hypothetical protein